ncbi:MAG: ABC transporter ATP-binding protein [Chloroflexota bacterium]|nr:MAG: nitrate/sulfonate/bicarbonate ABC transporter ATP-binding protein [Chloroflexota bacterium]
METTPLLECFDVGKTFQTGSGAVRALNNVRLAIPQGSFVALVGPSGCGKTTLLHILAGLDTNYNGRLISRCQPNRMSYVFQNPRLLPWLTAEQNVAFVLQARGDSRHQARKAAREYLQLVGLSGFENKYPSQLSGGMQQRVALARALAVEPDIMLMDEPFGSLDEISARKLRSELLRLFQELQKTVIFVTHNVTEAAYLADKIIVMGTHPGRVIDEINVDLPRPRDYDSPEVSQIARRIISQLHI